MTWNNAIADSEAFPRPHIFGDENECKIALADQQYAIKLLTDPQAELIADKQLEPVESYRYLSTSE
jgi:hypothetical protein